MKSFLTYLVIVHLIFLSGCSTEKETNNKNNLKPINTINNENNIQTVIATAANDYSSGAHTVLTPKLSYHSANSLDASGSDQHIVSYGQHIYRLGRFGLNNITKYAITSPATPIWQFSTQNEDQASNSNPYDLVFVNETKAYLLRYGNSKIWIVNPSADSEIDFKIGEIDLSAYADEDGLPEISQGLIIEDKLYVLMQRLVNFEPSESVAAYVAVIDTNNDSEIDTQTEDSDLKGIALSLKNPNKLEQLNNQLFISAVGKYAVTWTDPVQAAEYSGGIEAINLDDFSLDLILDDGDDENHPYGQIKQVEILNDTQGYFVGYIDGFNDALYTFNPATGDVNSAPLLKDKSIRDIAIDPLHHLWVGIGVDHALMVFDTKDNSILIDHIDTDLDPINITFIQQAN